MQKKLKCPYCDGANVIIKSEIEEEVFEGFSGDVETFYRYCNDCGEEYVDSTLSDINCDQFTKFRKKAKLQKLQHLISPEIKHFFENKKINLDPLKVNDLLSLYNEQWKNIVTLRLEIDESIVDTQKSEIDFDDLYKPFSLDKNTIVKIPNILH